MVLRGVTEHPPDWSPDGQRLAFVSVSDGGGGLETANADGTGRRMLDRAGYDPAWAPDGQRLAYVGRAGSSAALFIINTDGSGKRTLKVSPPPRPSGNTQAGLVFSSPAWSPDGELIAFIQYEQCPAFASSTLLVRSPVCGPSQVQTELRVVRSSDGSDLLQRAAGGALSTGRGLACGQARGRCTAGRRPAQRDSNRRCSSGFGYCPPV